MEIDNMVRDIEQRLTYQGLNYAQYLQMMGKTEADARNEMKEQAEIQVKTKLVLEAIVKEEKIEASEEDVKAKLEEMAKMYGRDAKELEENESLKLYITETIKTENAIKLIVENAKIK